MINVLMLVIGLATIEAPKPVIHKHPDGTTSMSQSGRRIARWDSLGNARVWMPDGTILVYEQGKLVGSL